MVKVIVPVLIKLVEIEIAHLQKLCDNFLRRRWWSR
jgi:hypothetical protein